MSDGRQTRVCRAAHAGASRIGTHWADLTRHCLARIGPLQRDELGFVYASDHLAPHLPAIVDQLRLASGHDSWIGTLGLGVLGNDGAGDVAEYFDEPAISLMALPVAPDSFRLLDPNPGGSSSRLRAISDWMAARHPCVGIVHGNPTNGHLPALMRQLSSSAGLFLLGGLTASRHGYLQVAGETGEAALSGALLTDAVSVATGLSQGCSPIGPQHVVTEVEDSIIKSLDGEPALAVLKREIGEVLSRDLNRIAGFIFAALPVPGSDTGDFLVRNITGIDSNRQWLAIGADLAEGQSIMFTRRDRAGAEADLARMLQRLKARLDRPVKGGLYVSCVARGPSLFGPHAVETGIIRQHLGDFPLTGFFANGEISHDRCYAYTGVLTLFL
ncbi:small ligand-binding sensory domain FIST [Dongia mobilis]|uniref:Small ligand-binding sensory domain FIST n=1 Tax=Dongia mobilis TaxID=578943 RepID=A0A4R6WRS5_9PROT|nr:FIST C-terminal domain-containing protein [Dongia mobilis]TDQ84312.1 small ligand-binding sensory domain FIST [Dongia mobilis]